MVKLNQKWVPVRSNIGKAIKRAKDGKINQKIPVDKADTFSVSPVSIYSQTKAKIEVSGNEAKTAAQKEVRLANSETLTKIMADKKILSA